MKKEDLVTVPFILLIPYCVLKVILDGLFNPNGIYIPIIGINPHAFTLLIWCANFLICWYLTRNLNIINRFIIISGIMMFNISTVDLGWQGQRIIESGNFYVVLLYRGQMFYVSLILLLMLYAYDYFFKLHALIRPNKLTLLLVMLFIISMFGLYFDNYFINWQNYAIGIGVAPQSWYLPLCRLSSYSLGTTLIRRNNH